MFQSDDAIIATMTLPKFRMKWVADQSKKDQYKQFFIHTVRLNIDDDVIETDNQAQQPESLTNNRGEEDHFYDLDLDQDCTTQSCIESEVNDYLSNTKQPECLNK